MWYCCQCLYPSLSAVSRCALISVQYGMAIYNRGPYARLLDRSRWTYTNGTRAKIKCDTGYALDGPTFAYCTETGWTQLPTCNMSNKYTIIFKISFLCK